jgi:hypothetical protein
MCLFCCQKTAFVCEFQHTPLQRMMFLLMFYTGGMRFLGYVPNSLRNKNMRGTHHIYFKKWFSWPSKLYCPLGAHEKKLFH